MTNNLCTENKNIKLLLWINNAIFIALLYVILSSYVMNNGSILVRANLMAEGSVDSADPLLRNYFSGIDRDTSVIIILSVVCVLLNGVTMWKLGRMLKDK